MGKSNVRRRPHRGLQMQPPIALKLHSLYFWACLIVAHPAKIANVVRVVRVAKTSQHQAVSPMMGPVRMPRDPTLSLPAIPM